MISVFIHFEVSPMLLSRSLREEQEDKEHVSAVMQNDSLIAKLVVFVS